MEVSFDFIPERKYYAVRFTPGTYESVPFIRELRFWGVDRVPCPRLSTLAALIALKDHHVTTLTLPGVEVNPAICSALLAHFGVEIHPANYDINRRDLAGGEKSVASFRFKHGGLPQWLPAGFEVLTWISLDDLDGPYGGQIRANLDAFNLTESDKDLVIALCCAGKDVGHILLADADPQLVRLLHLMGLELIDATEKA